MNKLIFKFLTSVTIFFSIVTVTFGEEAPVFDADNYSPQYENQAESQAETFPSAVSESGSAPSPNVEQRVTHADQQMSSMQQNDLNTKVNSLQNDIQTLRGQVEELTHQLQQMQNQQRAMYADIDKRLNPKPATKPVDSPDNLNNQVAIQPKIVKKKMEKESTEVAEVPSTPPAATDTSDNQPNVAEEQQTYQAAYDLIKSKKYTQAVQTLQKMLQKYPTGQFAANSHYWLGEIYGLMGKNDLSAVEFSTVVKNYPESPKVSDAQLKLGLIYAAQFKWSEAKDTFKGIINQYPGSASAHLASEQLKQIRQAGH